LQGVVVFFQTTIFGKTPIAQIFVFGCLLSNPYASLSVSMQTNLSALSYLYETWYSSLFLLHAEHMSQPERSVKINI